MKIHCAKRLVFHPTQITYIENGFTWPQTDTIQHFILKEVLSGYLQRGEKPEILFQALVFQTRLEFNKIKKQIKFQLYTDKHKSGHFSHSTWWIERFYNEEKIEYLSHMSTKLADIFTSNIGVFIVYVHRESLKNPIVKYYDESPQKKNSCSYSLGKIHIQHEYMSFYREIEYFCHNMSYECFLISGKKSAF